MAWRITGTYYAPCSCNVGCPCTLGELQADQGWCSGGLTMDIRSGNIDGVNVGGTKVSLNVDWPAGMLSGDGTGRLYFDPAVSQQQRAALEAVLTGKRGGVFEAIGALVPSIRPSKEARINIQKDSEDVTRITVGDFGELVVKPLRGANGQPTRLLNAAAAFREEINLADGRGSRWRDPDMKPWDSAGHAEYTDFDWTD